MDDVQTKSIGLCPSHFTLEFLEVRKRRAIGVSHAKSVIMCNANANYGIAQPRYSAFDLPQLEANLCGNVVFVDLQTLEGKTAVSPKPENVVVFSSSSLLKIFEFVSSVSETNGL